MQILSAVIARPREACWRAFVDPMRMPSWVPGLRSANVVASRPDGLPREVEFAYAAGLTYALLYTYDTATHVVRWEPKQAARGGVRGFARFEDADEGTHFTYALEHDTGRKAAERALDDADTLVQAFARWMHEERD